MTETIEASKPVPAPGPSYRGGRGAAAPGGDSPGGAQLAGGGGERIAADMRLDIGRDRGRPLGADRRVRAGDALSGVPRPRPSAPAGARAFVQRRHVHGRGRAGGRVRNRDAHQLGRIAALSQEVKEEPSPLDQQVRSVSWLIAKVAVALAVAFVPPAIFDAAAHPVPVHRLGRRRAPQVGDPDPVLAARAGRHTSTRRLTFGTTSNEYGSRTAPSDSVASTRWPLAAVAGVLRGAWQSATSPVGGASH
jgi:hypothetical protein